MSIYNISEKQTNNNATPIHQISLYSQFLQITNQILLTKKIYNQHKLINGSRHYLHFKSIVPNRMKCWILSKNNLDQEIINNFNMYQSNANAYLNKLFIDENRDLYSELKEWDASYTHDKNKHPETNVYLAYSNDDMTINVLSKRITDLTADEIRNVDLWEEQTTNVDSGIFRYKNEIPYWQKTMNTRHYDRTNEGYRHDDADRATLINQNHGYDMSNIVKASESYKVKIINGIRFYE